MGICQHQVLEALNGDIRVAGCSFPGIPFIVTAGHNEHLAWGISWSSITTDFADSNVSSPYGSSSPLISPANVSTRYGVESFETLNGELFLSNNFDLDPLQIKYKKNGVGSSNTVDGEDEWVSAVIRDERIKIYGMVFFCFKLNLKNTLDFLFSEIIYPFTLLFFRK